jgi:hypothetical protein
LDEDIYAHENVADVDQDGVYRVDEVVSKDISREMKKDLLSTEEMI